MKVDDVRLLIRHYMVEELTKKREIKSLRKSARKFIFNKKLSSDEKINILFKVV